jgi:hypothetical protein
MRRPRYGSLTVSNSGATSVIIFHFAECTAIFRQEKTMLDIEAPVTVCGEFLEVNELLRFHGFGN